MSGNTRRRQPLSSFLSMNPRQSRPRQIEEELTLQLTPEDLFDQYVLLPHAELNDAVYTAINQFVTRYDGSELKVSILGCSVIESTQEFFREVYRAHYDDEYEKVARYLRRRYMRIIALLIVSIVAFSFSTTLILQASYRRSFLKSQSSAYGRLVIPTLIVRRPSRK